MSLLDNIEELKKCNSALSGSMELENIQSYIDDAINNFIIPEVGYEQVTALIIAKGDDPSEKEKRLIFLLQKSAVGFMIYYWADQGAVEFSDVGIHVAKSDKKAPASDKKIISLKKQNISAGYSNLEMAISFLEENINDFPIYNSSPEHIENRSLLINTAKEFQKSGVNINNDVRLYRTLRVYQSDMESTYIEPVLGYDLKQALHLGIRDNSLDEIHQSLLKKVQRAIANYTIYEAIPFMAINIDASGIYQLSETVGGISGNVENKQAATDKMLARAMNNSFMKAEQELEAIRKFLVANYNQLNYTTPESVDINDQESNIYFL